MRYRGHDYPTFSSAAAATWRSLRTEIARLIGGIRPRTSAAAGMTWWRTLRTRTASTAREIGAAEWKRLGAHALALALVGLATVAKVLIGATDAGALFLLASAAVAASASVGGFSSGAVAGLAALLVARVTSPVSPTTSVLFAVEALLIALLVGWMSRAIQQRRRLLETAEGRIRELLAVERHGRAIETAFRRLEAVSEDFVILMLDHQGRITSWRDEAERLYGSGSGRIIGTSGAALYSPALAEDEFTKLLADARRGAVARRSGRHRRADGTPFDADVEIQQLSEHGTQGFTMLIRDRTREQEWRAFAAATADSQAALRQEADAAQRQLAALQSVTDPSLNGTPEAQMVTALLDRLREAVAADGVALVQVDASTPRVFLASGGLQPTLEADRPHASARSLSDGRVQLIQNDPHRVAEMSVMGWPDAVSSLITVPVLHGGRLQGAIEVVDLRGRRSTEWEIALIQVVAARTAGMPLDGCAAAAPVADRVRRGVANRGQLETSQ
jgi:PAS domain S-box-containing protein